MTGAVGKARDSLVATEHHRRRIAIAERPAAFAWRNLDERARIGAVDRRGGRRFGNARCLRVYQAQELALRRNPGAAVARRARARRRPRGPRRRKAEAVDFADHRVTTDPDLGGDLAARQACDDEISQLFDPLRGPGLDAHGTASRMPRPVLGRRRVKAARNRAPAAGVADAESVKSVCDGAQGAAITEPHPRFRDGKPAVKKHATDRDRF